ncbi:MAG: hypothetical protein JXR97_04430, partial [Planctomycetes bacterium]|nr:hypothetical protein [Planctomycetota bacterium]
MRKTSIILFMILSVSSVLVAGEEETKKAAKQDAPAPLPQSAEVKEILSSHAPGFIESREAYHKSLETARAQAAQKGNLEEVKNLEAALAGEYAGEFASYTAKTAKKSFDGKVDRLTKTLTYELKEAMKKILVKGDTEEAERINNLVERIDAAKSGTGGVSGKTISVEAVKDWQPTGIVLTKGLKVKLVCKGKWSSGARKKVGSNRWENIYGDADTYNIQARVGGSKAAQGGAEWDFVAANEGELLLRMFPYRSRANLAEAKGTMSVTISVEDTNPTRGIENLLAEILKPGAIAAAPVDKK